MHRFSSSSGGRRSGSGRGRRSVAGFTLLELLISITIIGLISAAGMVSYSTVRSMARDAKRVSDIRQVQAAIEIFFESHSYYPSDLNSGVQGLVLGDDARSAYLSDAGFSSEVNGMVYMAQMPRNPEPYGAPYVYRSLNRDGSDCFGSRCDNYALLFYLERGSGDYAVGPHTLSPIGMAADTTGYEGQDVVIGGSPDSLNIEGAVDRYATETARVVQVVRSDETVQQVTEKAVAPTVGVMAVANTLVATGSQLYHLFFFLLQPLHFLRRRKGQAWGTVYNSLSHLPEDLAIVRLHDFATRRILKSQVTDIKGRFSFLVGPGSYVLSVSKVGYSFPSAVVQGKTTDGAYENVYGGDTLEVTGEGAVITPSIPIDPPDAPETVEAVSRREASRRRRHNVATLAFGLGIVSFGMRPTMFTGLLLAAQLVVYMLFRRLAEPDEPKNWGVVFDAATERPIAKAVVRIFEGKYNKLLETQVTDRLGRYHFRFGSNVYYITVTKPGYLKTETNKLDLKGADGATVIASDLPLQRDTGYTVAPSEEKPKVKTGLLVPPGGKKSVPSVSGLTGGTPAKKAAVGAGIPSLSPTPSNGDRATVSIDLILPSMARRVAAEVAEEKPAAEVSEIATVLPASSPEVPAVASTDAPAPPLSAPQTPVPGDESAKAPADSPPLPDPRLVSPSVESAPPASSPLQSPGATSPSISASASSEVSPAEKPPAEDISSSDHKPSKDADFPNEPPSKAWFRD